MTYFDPSSFIAQNDELIIATENIIKLPKRAYLKQSARGLVPVISLEFKIIIKQTQQELRVTYFVDLVKRVKINLELTPNTILRKGHFNYTTYHHNPGGRMPNVPPPHHIHFPTKLHPDLNAKTKYGYPVSCTNIYEVILNKYCEHCNILVDGAPLSLLKSWGRQLYGRTED